MKLRTKLTEFAKAVAEVAERDPDFAARLGELFGADQPKPERSKPPSGRPKNRRPAAVLDPVVLAKEGEAALRKELAGLSLERLKDVVADHRIDPNKAVMKWKDKSRIIDHIVNISLKRSQKGNAFRAE